MRVFTGQPPHSPHRCAVFAYKTGQGQSERFIDTDVDFEVGAGYERLYLSETAIKEMAREFGHPTSDEHILTLAKNAELATENQDLKAQLEEADRELNQISYLKGRGYQPVKRAGRPPTKKAA